jgi:hypothetical protein
VPYRIDSPMANYILARETAHVVNDGGTLACFSSPSAVAIFSDGEEDYIFESVRRLLIPV